MKKIVALFSITTLLVGGFFFTQPFSTHTMEVEPSVLSVNTPEV